MCFFPRLSKHEKNIACDTRFTRARFKYNKNRTELDKLQKSTASDLSFLLLRSAVEANFLYVRSDYDSKENEVTFSCKFVKYSLALVGMKTF